eukprot:1023901-Pyramimonas_sp.AAC.2
MSGSEGRRHAPGGGAETDGLLLGWVRTMRLSRLLERWSIAGDAGRAGRPPCLKPPPQLAPIASSQSARVPDQLLSPPGCPSTMRGTAWGLLRRAAC